MAAVANDDFETARNLVFGENDSNSVEEIMGYVDEFQVVMNKKNT